MKTFVAALLLLTIFCVYCALRERVASTMNFDRDIVFCQGLDLTDGDSLLGRRLTRIVSSLSDYELREGKYLPGNNVPFS